MRTVSWILAVSVILSIGCVSTPVSKISVKSIPGDNYEVSVEFTLDNVRR